MGGFSGTGLQWKYEWFVSNALGEEVFNSEWSQCNWKDGTPPLHISDFLNPSELVGECGIRPQICTDRYYLVKISVKNDCGTQVRKALVKMEQAPSQATVNFGFLGSFHADQVASYGAGNSGASETFNGVVSDNDGWLSWGGTESNPTKVGPSLTLISQITINDLSGSLNSVTIKIEDVNTSALIGKKYYLPVAARYSINDMTNGYFQTNFEVIKANPNNKFKVTLTGNGDCNQNPSKVGYFTIFSTANSWDKVKSNTNNIQIAASDLESYKLLENDEDFTNFQLSIVPNPSNDIFKLSIQSTKEGKGIISIFDIQGKIIEKLEPDFSKGWNQFTLNSSSWNSGIYTVKIVEPSTGKSIVEKILKVE